MQIETTLNVSDEVLFRNVLENSKRNIPWLKAIPEHDKQAVIVGGGPSVADWLNEIRYRKSQGQTIFALNGAAKFLHGHGVESDYTVVVDARPHNIKFLRYSKEYLLSSQCDPSLFRKESSITLWHQEYPEDMERFDSCLPDGYPEHTLIGGGTTVGLSAMVIAYAMGYRKIHLYGYDSSYRGDAGHAYLQHDPQGVECTVTVAGRQFKSTLAMARQAELFPQLSDSLIDLGCLITMRGDGLLPWTSQQSAIKPEPIAEQDKYKKMWEIDAYRNAAPGEAVAGIFNLAANPKRGDLVIDFGAGTGRGAHKIHKQRGCNVLMLDFADNCLDPQVKAALSKDFTFQVADLTEPLNLAKAKYGFCTDVMEHIEPEKVDAVLVNIFRSAENVFFQISLVPDNMGVLIGHPLHLTVQPFEWWVEKLSCFGKVTWSEDQGIAALFYVQP